MAEDFDPDALIDANAKAVGLTITAEQRVAVRQYVLVAHAMAQILEGVPLKDDLYEQAPVFTPGKGA